MKRSPSIQKEILTTREAAELINVTAQTIKNYIYSGKLKSLKTPGGHHRIRRIDLEDLGFSLSRSQVESGIAREDIFVQYNQQLEAYKKTIEVLLKALDRRDAIGSGHSVRVADYSSWMADMLNLSVKERENIMMAALLHDVGKIGIKEEILSKNGKLNSEEIAIIQKHPEIGEKIVKEADCLKPTQALIRHHHERFDGKGYPDGVKGEKIPIGARIISLAETYDFLRSDLPFRPAFSTESSVAEIKRVSGSQFDPALVKVFVENLERRAFH
jgi:excisionase family DNA binding protein